MRLAYIIGGYILLLLSMPILLKRLYSEPGFWQRLKESFGFWPREKLHKVADKQAIWLHAASVGEVVAAQPIIKKLRDSESGATILVSVVTHTGYAMANQLLIGVVDAIIFFPFDIYGLATRALRIIKPRLFVPVETELWPNFLNACAENNVKVVLVNGRISDRSAKRYRWLGSLLRKMLTTVGCFSVQSEQDKLYLQELGADERKIIVNGNTKFAVAHEILSTSKINEWRQLLHINEHDKLLIAGSTYEMEEDGLLRCWRAIKQAVDNVKCIVAPRDIRRSENLLNKIKDKGFTAVRRSQIGAASAAEYDFVVLDSIGELGKLYALADVVFVGGSMFPRGGHNILEPAGLGKAVVTGPYTFNFKDINALLLKDNGCIVVDDFSAWQTKIIDLMQKPLMAERYAQNALSVIAKNRGAVERNVNLILRYYRQRIDLSNE